MNGFEQKEVDLSDYKSKLVNWNDSILKTPTQFFDCIDPPIDPVKLYNDLVMELCFTQGIGITANQIGIPYSVILLRDGTIMFNPRIITTSQEQIELEETSIIFPTISCNISRSRHCKIRYQEMFIPGSVKAVTDNTVTKQFTGITARIILQCLDSLKGLPFFYNVSRIKLSNALKKSFDYKIDYTGIYSLLQNNN